MCYDNIQTCPSCSWVIQVTYPRCSHAKAYCLEPPACPMRMDRKHTSGGLCRACRGKAGSLSVLPGDKVASSGIIRRSQCLRRATKRKACRARRAKAKCGYGFADDDGNGSGNEDSGDEYVPSSTDDEGSESEEESEDDAQHHDALSPPRPMKRRLSSSPNIAQLIEQEAAQRKRVRSSRR
ncbi:hypothetical protein K458DRAFT_428684 [Lentithecium fluviatile CBS 122367]|uniref:Uncharacterized protein n=1 Tax=Lentithecium fluviatile CBS 122367 TaxID=1168545 RepID=A0A6G1JBD4_9PLEO|nr:hypothetical protein K458DRAFT_428684 [Lentithecium fluviatile CBS 122367]